MGDEPKLKIIKNKDTRKIHNFLKEMSLEECCVAMRVKCFMIDCAIQRQGIILEVKTKGFSCFSPKMERSIPIAYLCLTCSKLA